MSVTIRRIQFEDIDGFWHALDSVVSEQRYLLTVETPTREATTAFVARCIEKNYPAYVAIVDDVVVGWADILPYEKDLMQHAGRLGMGVRAEYRHQGIGRSLLRHAIKHARTISLVRIELEVFTYNLPAIALYEQLGFEHEGTKRYARYLNGRYEDVHFMAQCYPPDPDLCESQDTNDAP